MDTEQFLVRSDGRITVTFGSRSSVGMVRTENQDSCGVFLAEDDGSGEGKGILCVVADGMGGHRGGDEASALAVDVLRKTYFGSRSGNVVQSLREAFEAANRAVFERAREELRLHGMGSTCTALVLNDRSVSVGHIGDSRAYLVGKKFIEQLTRDHSRVAELLRHQMITEEEAKTHPQRSQLMRALGIAPTAEVEFSEHSVEQGESGYVLCSDGLSGPLEDVEIQKVVVTYPPQEACDRLIERANARGGYDNATVIVLKTRTRERFFTAILNRFRLSIFRRNAGQR